MSYVNLDTLKSGLGMTHTNDHDVVLELYRQASAERCDHYTGRVYGDDPGTGFEEHTLSGQVYELDYVSRVILREWPVVSISSITLAGSALVENSDYRIDLRTGVVIFTDSAGHESRVSGVLIVTFVAGFSVVPADVSLCCLRLSSYWFSRKDTEGMGSQLIGDLQESYRRPEEQLILQDTIGGYRIFTVR